MGVAVGIDIVGAGVKVKEAVGVEVGNGGVKVGETVAVVEGEDVGVGEGLETF